MNETQARALRVLRAYTPSTGLAPRVPRLQACHCRVHIERDDYEVETERGGSISVISYRVTHALSCAWWMTHRDDPNGSGTLFVEAWTAPGELTRVTHWGACWPPQTVAAVRVIEAVFGCGEVWEEP